MYKNENLKPSAFGSSLGARALTALVTLQALVSVACGPASSESEPPVVDLVTPNGIDSLCADEPIRFLATSRDLDGMPTSELPDSAIEWSVFGGADFGTGHSVTASFPEGGYTIVVRATNDEGLFAEDSVNLLVQTCPDGDSPPSVTILEPSVDSESSEDQYAYDGFDDVRGQWYTDVLFVGTGEDFEDGTLSGSSLQWSTNRTDVQDGTLGEGRNATVRLYSDSCFGTWHDVTLTATDSDGNERSAIRRIFVWTLC
ncbi:MAG: hypothetical protein KJO40_05400 [Deltaproteobacteria bacterium]|nr:hypothetical protein [Deltaproteobacteria bacterium]NND28082.1 hypothetical protein [Myxococcales bacterium]MBT8463272.1 hypothetical protein [Deltaproteobacteria bacterium]NNK09493.1 hypothetical protein [Myxococcales bacterium]NNK41583.1 hypothetical protein [Myxococcales bacterium]